MNRAVIRSAVLGLYVCVAAVSDAHGDEAGERREPFAAPRTEAELRWLMDQSEAQRFQLIKGTEDERRGRIEPGYVWPEGVTPELKRIQEELGGSAVEGFPALRDAKPPATADLRQAAAEGAAAPVMAKGREVAALREAAAQLDGAANRLEWLELYAQADALREQAQRLRVDARGMKETAAATPMPTLEWEGGARPLGSVPLRPRPRQPENPQNPTTPSLQPPPELE